ncbi:MAG TPA: acyltransferase [Actinomycetota bacterium]|nr:acyltransferase [Actinomycetota bacterium]
MTPVGLETWRRSPGRWGMALRYLWFRLRNPHVVTNGMVFLGRGVEIHCTRGLGHLEIGREVWIGRGTAIRCHEGFLRIGDGVVFGGEDTVNCYLDVEIGDDCLFADRVYVGDFDHRHDDLGTPIQQQGIVKSPVRIGPDCWIGEKATFLRGSTVGEGSVIGASTVVRGRFPARSVVVGNPGRLVKVRGQ